MQEQENGDRILRIETEAPPDGGGTTPSLIWRARASRPLNPRAGMTGHKGGARTHSPHR
jgi:hypothetical protein